MQTKSFVSDFNCKVMSGNSINSGTWSVLGTGVGGTVTCIVASGNDIYVGGAFITAGGNTVNNIAKWNGSSWTSLGTGMNGVVLALAVSGNDLYAGGQFTTAGGVPAIRIAKWDGSVWASLGSGLDDDVLTITVKNNIVYAGGDFLMAGVLNVNNIAFWNGSEWSSMGSGMNGPVLALAISGDSLFAGGGFTSAGGTSANYIAKWYNNNWTSLNTGMNNPVEAISISGSDLYAGGGFTISGGLTTDRIAKWNGSVWSAVGNGISDEVRAVSASGNIVYAGGLFSNNITVFDGTNWLLMGNGINNYVTSIITDGIKVYAGGSFGIKRWDPLPVAITENAININSSSATLHASVNPNGIETSAFFYYSTDNAFFDFSTTLLQNIGNGSNFVAVSENITELEPNTTYYYYAAGDNGLGIGTGEVQSFTTDSPLPVEVTSFTSSVNNRNVILNWTTSLEQNNSGFDIERKTAGESNWSKIGNVVGKGISNVPLNYSYEDRNLNIGKYNYRLKQIDYNGNFAYHNLSGEVIIGLPAKFDLSQNYPNPFNPSTKINYELPADSKVSLKIFDMLGREVANLVNEIQNAGYYTVQYNGANIASGIYFYKLETEQYSSIKKMILIK